MGFLALGFSFSSLIKSSIPHFHLVSPRRGPSYAYVRAVYRCRAPRFWSRLHGSSSDLTGRSYGRASSRLGYRNVGSIFARTGYHSYMDRPSGRCAYYGWGPVAHLRSSCGTGHRYGYCDAAKRYGGRFFRTPKGLSPWVPS